MHFFRSQTVCAPCTFNIKADTVIVYLSPIHLSLRNVDNKRDCTFIYYSGILFVTASLAHILLMIALH